MDIHDLAQKYTGRGVDGERIEELFRHMGKFGKMTVYGFAFETDNANVSMEVCVKGGKIVGFTPEKEPRVADEWGFGAEEPYTEELTPEECGRIDRYLASVLEKEN